MGAGTAASRLPRLRLSRSSEYRVFGAQTYIQKRRLTGTRRYLVAPSVGDKFNITWGNQTFGGQFEADGRLKGDLHLEDVPCDQANNVCRVRVPAPGFALVFMSDDAARESEPASTATFATTAITKYKNTATVDPAVLATSNGNKGMGGKWGSTSYGSGNSAVGRATYPGLGALLGVVVGVGGMMRVLARQM